MQHKLLSLLVAIVAFSLNCAAQFGSTDKTFSDFGINDPKSLGDMDIAEGILKDPYLFDAEKEIIFLEMSKLDSEEVQSLPALQLRFWLQTYLGIQWDNSRPSLSNTIIKVHPNTSAEDMGLMANDIIQSVNECKITSGEELGPCLEAIQPGDHVRITVKRDDQVLAFSTNIRNRMGTYQPWKDEYFMDIVLGTASLEDFKAKADHQGTNDPLLSILTPDGQNHIDLLIPRELMLLDTVLSRQILEDSVLNNYQKKLILTDITNLPRVVPYFYQQSTTKRDTLLTSRKFMQGVIFRQKFSPNFGISLLPIPSKEQPKVVEIDDTGSVHESGIKLGDYLLQVDGIAILGDFQLFVVLQEYKAGDTVRVLVERDGQPLSFDVRLKNHFGTYQPWKDELNDAITDNNYDLEEYHYLADKKFVRDTSLWGCPVKQLAITASIDLKFGYLPNITYAVEIFFYTDEDKLRFETLSKENNLTILLMTKKESYYGGPPDDPLLITLPKIEFQDGDTKVTGRCQFEMSDIFMNPREARPVMSHLASTYFKMGFEIFGIYLLENDAQYDLDALIDAYLVRDRNKYSFPRQESNTRTKKQRR